MERIRVFHDEFARAHHAETRAHFIAKLGLNLIKIRGQLFVAFNLVADQIGDDLLVRRAETEGAVVAILQAREFGAVLHPAA